jgi:tetratricopeptide (TPR) repeat protein
LDKIAKMLDGSQMVAALDRINQVLEEHPDAAWALAIKGRVLIQLQEYGKLEENSDRFLRLQPSNPLALLQKSLAVLSRSVDCREAAEHFLAALAERQESSDPLMLEVAGGIGVSLATQGNLLSAREYLTIAAMVNLPIASTAAEVLHEISGNRSISVLLKQIPEPWSAPAGVPWGERYEEAERLLESHAIQPAESKLQSLDRQFPHQPAILASLLQCAIWRTDQEEQSRIIGKLADCTSLPEEQRDRFRALNYLTEVDQPKLGIPSRDILWEVERPEAVLAALTADPHTLLLPPEMTRDLVFEEGGVPPKAAFQVLDRPKPYGEGLPDIESTPEVLGMVLLFGRQTDHPARVAVLNTLRCHEPQVVRQLTNAIGPEVGEPQFGEEHFAQLLNVVLGTIPMLRLRSVKLPEMRTWQNQLVKARGPQRFLNTPLRLLDDRTPREALSVPNLKGKLAALVRALESYDVLATDAPEVLEAIRHELGVSSLPSYDLGNKDPRRVSLSDLCRINVASLGAEQSLILMERARVNGLRSAAQRLAQHLLELSLGGELKNTKISAYLLLAEFAGDMQKSLEYLDAAKRWAKENSVSNASILLSEISFRVHAGDAQGLQRCINSIMAEHATNQKVIVQMQQILVMYGILNPDGTPRRMPGTAPVAAQPPAPPSGLWTPNTPAPTAAAAGGKSKLWMPGME